MSSWSPSSSIALGSESHSHILSQSLPSPDPFDVSESSHIHTGPGGADLSLSELSLSDKSYGRDAPRFSLLAPPPAPLRISADQSAIIESEEQDGNASIDVDEHDDDADNTMMARAVGEKAREEKLRSDLFILKKLNASFAVLSEALEATKGATEQVTTQLSQTDMLLDKYTNMLAKSESVTRLIFDERWEGADADEALLLKKREEALEREREEAASREAEERARREAEEAAQREAERAKQEAATAAAILAVKAPPAKGRSISGSISSGVRGVRGTRATAAAMASRGTRGTSRMASTSVSSIPRTRSASATGSVGSGGSGTRPSSVASRGSGLPRGAVRRG